MRLSRFLRAVDHPYITGAGGRKANNGKGSMQVIFLMFIMAKGAFYSPRSPVQTLYNKRSDSGLIIPTSLDPVHTRLTTARGPCRLFCLFDYPA